MNIQIIDFYVKICYILTASILIPFQGEYHRQKRTPYPLDRKDARNIRGYVFQRVS